jgi:hypothetical protein
VVPLPRQGYDHRVVVPSILFEYRQRNQSRLRSISDADMLYELCQRFAHHPALLARHAAEILVFMKAMKPRLLGEIATLPPELMSAVLGSCVPARWSRQRACNRTGSAVVAQRRPSACGTTFHSLDSLEEYVLVSQDERCIEVRKRQGRNWVRGIKHAGETITIHGAMISVDAL